jgi:cytochrome c-type biogenesis protein CcmF
MPLIYKFTSTWGNHEGSMLLWVLILSLTFDRIINRAGPNYSELAASFTVRRHGEIVGIMEPSKRAFASRNTSTTESALMARGVSQLYMSLGDVNPDGSAAIRLYYKPWCC